MAAAANTIIVVANYRLNVFGYLAGDALRNESRAGGDGSVGNYGMADQRQVPSI